MPQTNEQLIDDLISLANSSADAGDLDSARLAYERALKIDPRCFVALANYALLLSEDLKSNEAISVYERALKEDSSWVDGLFNLANLQSSLGDEPSALKNYKLAADLRPMDPDILNNYAICLMATGRLLEALEQEKRALRLKKCSSFYANIAEIFHQLGDLKKAIYWANKCDGDSVQVSFLLATLHLEQGNEEEAVALLEKIHQRHLAAAVQYFSILMKRGARDAAKSVLVHCKTQYEQDMVGLAFIDVLIGEEDVSTPPSMKELSIAAEVFLLNLRLPDSSQLAHKCLLAKNLSGLSTCIIPETTLGVVEELVSFLADTQETFYVKDPSVQRGQGILILTPPYDKDLLLRRFQSKKKRLCLQRAINPLLLNGRKFGLRIHVFLFFDNEDLTLYIQKDGILTLCANTYDHQSSNVLSQITCTSVQRGVEGFNLESVKGPASEMWPDFATKGFPQIVQAVETSIKAVRGKLGVTKGYRCGQLFGYDFLFDYTGKPFVIEVNIAPQFQHAKKNFLLEKVGYGLINGIVPALQKREQADWVVIELGGMV